MKKLLLAVLSLSVLTACGGGGGGGSASSTVGPNSVAGVASVGAPLGDASISLISLTNQQVFNSTNKTSADGSFNIEVNKALYPPPYLMRVTGKVAGKVTSQYAFIENTGTSGLVVTPISSGVISLLTEKTADSAFSDSNSWSVLSTANVLSKAAIFFKSLETVYAGLGIDSANKLISDGSFRANATGADAVLDAFRVGYKPNLQGGDIVLTSKFSGKSIEITPNSTTSNVGQIGLEARIVSGILSGINQNVSCIFSAVSSNSASQAEQCLATGFKDQGLTTARAFLDWHFEDVLGTTVSPEIASIKWCDFDNTALSFETSSLIANQSGKCLASVPVKKNGEVIGVFDGIYRFTINSNATGLSSVVKLYGNQIDYIVGVYAAIQKKDRIDFSTNNTGVTSGYRFDVDTGYDSQSSPIRPASVISAKVEILDFQDNVVSNGTFYMQCVNSPCNQSTLSVCVDNCSGNSNARFDLKSDGIISVNSSIADTIVQKMKLGPVRAKITAYDGVLFNNLTPNSSKAVVYEYVQPLTEVPVSQAAAESINLPTIDQTSINALRSWEGGSNLDITYDAGDASMFENMLFGYIDDQTFLSDDQYPTAKSGTVVRRNMTDNTSRMTPITTNCSGGPASYVSITLGGSIGLIPVQTKYFGSCYSTDW